MWCFVADSFHELKFTVPQGGESSQIDPLTEKTIAVMKTSLVAAERIITRTTNHSLFRKGKGSLTTLWNTQVGFFPVFPSLHIF